MSDISHHVCQVSIPAPEKNCLHQKGNVELTLFHETSYRSQSAQAHYHYLAAAANHGPHLSTPLRQLLICPRDQGAAFLFKVIFLLGQLRSAVTGWGLFIQAALPTWQITSLNRTHSGVSRGKQGTLITSQCRQRRTLILIVVRFIGGEGGGEEAQSIPPLGN